MKESTARIGDGRTDTHDRTGSECFPSRWPEINNPLYGDIEINIGLIPENRLSLTEPIDIPIEFEEDNVAPDSPNIPEDDDNPLDNFRFGSTETMLVR